MNDYSEQYRQKLTDAASLAARVESGWVIGMDATTAQTPAIIDAISQRARAGELEDAVRGDRCGRSGRKDDRRSGKGRMGPCLRKDRI